MSTIASPRPPPPSSTLTTPTSSSRPSLSLSDLAAPTANHPQSSHPPPHPPPAPSNRRNRAALRDYYNLKSAAPSGEQKAGAEEQEQEVEDVKESELDRDGFDAEAYVRSVLRNEGMGGLLGVEGGLVSEIKSLDGERKALVYDNYSKLITATDTIRKMRTTMTPLAPTTSTLEPAIAHIADVASSLATHLQDHPSPALSPAPGPSTRTTAQSPQTEAAAQEQKKQQDTVRWVLGAPGRLRKMVQQGRREQAETEWEEVRGLLGKWEGRGVVGAGEVREEGEGVMRGGMGESGGEGGK